MPLEEEETTTKVIKSLLSLKDQEALKISKDFNKWVCKIDSNKEKLWTKKEFYLNSNKR